MNVLEIKDLCKSYGSFLLDHIGFDLPAGCVMGLVGENGAGKSTTIRLIMDAVKRDGGEIKVFGQDNRKNFGKIKEDIGIVLDEPCFPEELTVPQINRVMRGSYANWEEGTFLGYAEHFRLPAEGKCFKDFSRGMKMKTALAVALSHRAKLLILDEATSGLDPMARDAMLDILNKFTLDESHAVLLSSHIVGDLEKISDYVTFLHKGKLVFCEEKDRLLERYGILRCGKAQFETINGEAVKGYRASEYGVEALVDRTRLPSSVEAERASLEEIILFMARHDV